jgi:salicylate 5-hydroxylase large subunit
VVGQIGDYFGQEILRYFDRVFDGRKLTILGYSRQRIPGNWKLMQENIKDPYHVGLLHTWFVMFGLIRGDQKSRIIMDEHGRHGAMASTRKATKGGGEVTKGLHSFKQGMKLHDERIVDIKPEPWWNGPTVVMLTLFPNLIVQQQSNSMSTRQIMPRGTGAFDFTWTHFGFEDDDPDMALRRLRQANVFGPAGYVSADDGEVLEFCQESYERDSSRSTLAEQGGRDWSGSNHVITENVLRGMYACWRKIMEI